MEEAAKAFWASVVPYAPLAGPLLPGAAPIPKTDEEAAAMLQVVKAYTAAKKRKGALLAGAPRLIVPKGVH